MKFWTATIKSESGDDYGPFIFKSKPTKEKLKKWLASEFPGDADPDEYEDKPKGPGIFGTYLYIDWSETEVIEL